MAALMTLFVLTAIMLAIIGGWTQQHAGLIFWAVGSYALMYLLIEVGDYIKNRIQDRLDKINIDLSKPVR